MKNKIIALGIVFMLFGFMIGLGVGFVYGSKYVIGIGLSVMSKAGYDLNTTAEYIQWAINANENHIKRCYPDNPLS